MPLRDLDPDATQGGEGHAVGDAEDLDADDHPR
jgi:hypothetical protein